MKITKSIVEELLGLLDKGLCIGIGEPKPGKMCVEACVCYVIGQEHGDQPDCVIDKAISDKIDLNDWPKWKSKKERGNALRKVAVAQLGSRGVVNPYEYECKLWDKIEQKILPILIKKFKIRTKKKTITDINDELYDNEKTCQRFLHSLLSSIEERHMECLLDNISSHELKFPVKKKRDIVRIIIKCLLETLVELKSPGAKWLHLCK